MWGDRMETTFYPDDVLNNTRGISSIFSQDSMMKKDINSEDQGSANLKQDLPDTEGILNSPDLLKLASPELERLIIQSNGMVTTTPTSQFVYPKSVSDEQEFAEGFVKALEDLHKQNQLNGGPCLPPVSRLSANTSIALQTDLPVYTNLNTYGGSPLGTTVNYSTDTIPFPPPPSHPLSAQQQAQTRLQSLKDEPQTVPDIQSFGDSPPLSPIDMDTQERIKAERKRLRNRIAASKCRKRKLERISRLEDKVKTLKTQNTELASTASLLREQVAQLKQRVMNHVNNGCQLLPNQVQAYWGRKASPLIHSTGHFGSQRTKTLWRCQLPFFSLQPTRQHFRRWAEEYKNWTLHSWCLCTWWENLCLQSFCSIQIFYFIFYVRREKSPVCCNSSLTFKPFSPMAWISYEQLYFAWKDKLTECNFNTRMPCMSSQCNALLVFKNLTNDKWVFYI